MTDESERARAGKILRILSEWEPLHRLEMHLHEIYGLRGRGILRASPSFCWLMGH